MEQEILKYWDEIKAFESSLEQSKDKPVFSFYDGPPFATGLPHYGHLLAGTVKDIVTRFAHQTGHHVERRFGWDCHGLPVEHEIDKMFEIHGIKDVEKMGIENYNAECRKIVMRYSKEWEKTVKRMGRWIDFENDYKTMNCEFMESVWWVFQKLFNENKVYRGFRVMPYSTACNTPVANFEATQNYKETQDPSVVVSFPLCSDESTSFVAWTTTPWTLPSNLALCVNPNFEYVYATNHKNTFILLESRMEMLPKDSYKITKRVRGSELNGIEYIPLFTSDGVFRVLCDEYVTSDTGTGIVHQAPAFGEDDLRVCLKNKIVTEDNVLCPIDESGIFHSTKYKGLYFKKADPLIIKDLKEQKRVLKQSTITHQYPFCWRSDTPLMYRAIPSWFVRVQEIRHELMKNNLQSQWVPSFVQEKRFHNWLSQARDWNVSRNRYWGTPIPIWTNKDYSEIICIGSIEELETLTNTKVKDLHRESIDHLVIKGKTGDLHRISEVFDCWFESGSMPYAQQHYPFENQKKFNAGFPASFIAEGIDQTRGWFYTLLVISTHLFKQTPFKNLIVTGLVLASDGKKMSKRLKNYPDPTVILDKYGADALRLYLCSSPAVRAENLNFKEQGVQKMVSSVLIPFNNCFNFFESQVLLLRKLFNVDFEPKQREPKNTMDLWILSALQSLIVFVRREMKAYKLYTVVPGIFDFIEKLTNMYIRYNRSRLKFQVSKEDGLQAIETLFVVIYNLNILLAPFAPFVTEKMFLNLKKYSKIPSKSVHFEMIPEPNLNLVDEVIERRVGNMQQVIEIVRLVRDQQNIGLKTPLREIIIIHEVEFLQDIEFLKTYLEIELNVRKVLVSTDEEKYHVSYRAEADFKTLGSKLRGNMPNVKKALSELTSLQVKEFKLKGELELAGSKLNNSEIKVSKFYSGKEYESASSFDLLVLVDVTQDLDLIQESLVREIINRVQRLRKKALLVPTDDVDYFCFISTDPSDQLKLALESKAFVVEKTLRQSIYLSRATGNIIAEENLEISGSHFILSLVK